MGATLLASIIIRLVACALTLFFFFRDRRWPILFLTALTGLMASRQILTYRELTSGFFSGPWPTELPGLVVSFFALAIVLTYARLLKEDDRQYAFWSNIPRETGFVFVELTPDQRIRRVTGTVAGLLGYASSDLTDQSFSALFAPDSPIQALPPPEEVRDGGHGKRFDAILTAAEGRRVAVRIFARYLGNPLRTRRHYSLVIADRREEEESKRLQETIADLAREADALIANEGWGLAHVAERAAQALGVPRVTVWWLSPNEEHLRCAECFDQPTGRHTAGEILSTAQHPTFLEHLAASRTLAIRDIETDERTQTLAPAYLRPHGTTALLAVPILLEGRPGGAVLFEHREAPRAWNEVETAFAGSIGDLVALSHTAGVHRARAQHLAQQSYLDSLTGLLNAQSLRERLEELATDDAELGLLYVDMDQFRYLNDILGHGAGDRFLTEVARALVATSPPEAVLGRISGDEFVVVVPDMAEEDGLNLADDIQQRLTGITYELEGRSHTLTVSIGLAVRSANTPTAGDLLAAGDLACSRAKEAGRNQVATFQADERPGEHMSERLAMYHRLRRALTQDHFRLVYQPIVPLLDPRPVLHETLLRLAGTDRLLTPGAFMPTAERFALMPEVDRWVVDHAIAYLAEAESDLRLSINLSGRGFSDPGLFDRIRDRITEHAVDPRALTFEITETEAIANLAEAKAMIWRLRELGCRFALDDFGSGFASFAYLRELPVDMIKIDGRFIRELTSSHLDRVIVAALVDIARTLGVSVVAEFVEDEPTRQELIELGVDYGQGFHLGRPATEPELATSAATATID